MFALGNLLLAAARIVDVILAVLYWLILIRAIISWVNPDPFNPIVKFLQAATEPFLEPIRRLLPPMAIDISPIIAFLAVMFLQTFLVKTLVDVGLRFR